MVFRRRLIERTVQGDVVVYDGVWGFRVCGLCEGDEIQVYGYDGALVQRISVGADGCMEVDIPEDPQPLEFYDNVYAYVAFKVVASPEDLCGVSSSRWYVAAVPQTEFILVDAAYTEYDSAGNPVQSIGGQVQLARPHIIIDEAHVYYEVEIFVGRPNCQTRMTVQIPAQDQTKFVTSGMTGVDRWAVIRVVGADGSEKGNMRVWAGTMIRHRW